MLLATTLLTTAGLAHRAYAMTRPAAVPLPCGKVIGVASPLGMRVACPDDVSLAACRDVHPGRLYEGCVPIKPLRGPLLKLFGLPVDVASADVDDLRSLPGIGPALAERIIEAREKQPFCTENDLMRVPGIGRKRLEALTGRVEFGDANCAGNRPK